MARFRTIRGALGYIRDIDPDTAITEYYLRQLVLNGKIKSKKSGTRYLIDLDDLIDYLTETNE